MNLPTFKKIRQKSTFWSILGLWRLTPPRGELTHYRVFVPLYGAAFNIAFIFETLQSLTRGLTLRWRGEVRVSRTLSDAERIRVPRNLEYGVYGIHLESRDGVERKSGDPSCAIIVVH